MVKRVILNNDTHISAFDVAAYLINSNSTPQKSSEIIKDLFSNHLEYLVPEESENFQDFSKAVSHTMVINLIDENTLKELNAITDEVSGNHTDVIEEPAQLFFFKQMKLQLLYSGTGFVRMKLRSLLAKFGYKRRTAEFVSSVQEWLSHLEISVYLKGYAECSLAEMALDDMIIFRNR